VSTRYVYVCDKFSPAAKMVLGSRGHVKVVLHDP